MSTTRRRLDELVREIEDPELPHVTIGDLGIVRSVTVDGDTAIVLLTPTYTGCPATEQIRDDVERRRAAAGFEPDVRMVMSPAWTTDWISRARPATAARGRHRPAASPAARTTGSTIVDLVECPTLQLATHAAGLAVRRHGVQGELRVHRLRRAVRVCSRRCDDVPACGHAVDDRHLRAAARRVGRARPARLRDRHVRHADTTTVRLHARPARQPAPPVRRGRGSAQLLDLLAGTDGVLRIAIRQVPDGVFSQWATHELTPGDRVEVTAPAGHFTHELDPERARRYTFVAAGSGITPIFSIMATILDNEPRSAVSLWYLNRTAKSAMLLDDLQDLRDRYLGRLQLPFAFTREDIRQRAAVGPTRPSPIRRA